MNECGLIHDLEKLSVFLHGAHLVCDHDNSSSTFHAAKHMVDEIILNVKITTTGENSE